MTAMAVAAALVSPGVVFAVAPVGAISMASSDSRLSFTPSGVDPALAAQLRAKPVKPSAKFRFTPAGVDSGKGRAITVAVRTPASESANAVAIRNALAGMGGSTPTLKPTSYNLGKAKGWQSFALPMTQAVKAPQPGVGLSSGALGSFRLDEENKRPSRVSIDAKQNVASAPRTIEEGGDVGIDVGGRYRISRSVDVTAGVRYNETRDKAPLTDDRQDSQAVYVGTLIRF